MAADAGSMLVEEANFNALLFLSTSSLLLSPGKLFWSFLFFLPHLMLGQQQHTKITTTSVVDVDTEAATATSVTG
jgi:hypothetical protein